MFSLIEGMGAKTIRGSNHSLNHIGFLHTKHFLWEATRLRALGGWMNMEVHVSFSQERKKESMVEYGWYSDLKHTVTAPDS